MMSSRLPRRELEGIVTSGLRDKQKRVETGREKHGSKEMYENK